ncbi:MAG: NAD(+) synthase [bacterium]
MLNNQFIKVACVNIELQVGNPFFNVKEIIKCANKSTASITVFSELCITGYTCGDLFFQNILQKEVFQAIEELRVNNKNKGIVIVGAPLLLEGSLFNCAIVLKEDNILGVVPKQFLPNYCEFYEKRYFKSGKNTKAKEITINNKVYPFGNIIFSDTTHDLHLGVEICEDMWGANTPGSYLSVNGANVIINLSASNETLGKDEMRKTCVLDNARRNVTGYIYASSSVTESTSDLIFIGHNIVSEVGEEVLNNLNYEPTSKIVYADLDIDKINFKRKVSTNLHQKQNDEEYQYINFALEETTFKFENKLNQLPFVPTKKEEFIKVKNLLEMALYKRLSHTNAKTIVVGVSGGLDSTMALLVAVNTFKKLKKDLKDIIAVTMPGLGTSDRTKNNAVDLINSLGLTLLTKDIVESTLKHFELIEHSKDSIDITYENTQARIRTLILMNLANKHNGLVLGTGDMSELALGFCTYNGDQMSMYGINAGLPKTTIRFLVEQYANTDFKKEKEILLDVVNTPISPELIKNQVTENQIGKYEINDFIMFRYLTIGDNKERINFLLEQTFGLNSEEAVNYTNNFFRRFFSQQFKRQTLPDGPKVLEVSLSPRGDYRMPSDIKR